MVVIDKTRLPHVFATIDLTTIEDAAVAIETMVVRGAPLIGVTAAYGMALGAVADPSDEGLEAAALRLLRTRPTAVNLHWAVGVAREALAPLPPADRVEAAYRKAAELADEDAAMCSAIGDHGLGVIEKIWEAKGGEGVVNVLTHCNAGWLAAVDWGTALAPVYRAHRSGLPVHVWVSETRPRNQGAALTAWELAGESVPHTVVPDNASGHLLRTGRVDLVLTGTDRTTAAGDVCNKIGTYMKAVAARDCGVPFYVAVPGASIDWSLGPGDADRIPIEERAPEEVSEVRGLAPGTGQASVQITSTGTPVANFGFDVTPARLVSGLVTERGVCEASPDGLASLYPERTFPEGRRS